MCTPSTLDSHSLKTVSVPWCSHWRGHKLYPPYIGSRPRFDTMQERKMHSVSKMHSRIYHITNIEYFPFFERWKFVRQQSLEPSWSWTTSPQSIWTRTISPFALCQNKPFLSVLPSTWTRTTSPLALCPIAVRAETTSMNRRKDPVSLFGWKSNDSLDTRYSCLVEHELHDEQ